MNMDHKIELINPILKVVLIFIEILILMVGYTRNKLCDFLLTKSVN